MASPYPIDPKTFAEATSRILKRFGDVGWLASTKITPGHLHITYTARGRERMEQLRGIITKELRVALTFEEFQALMGLILTLDASDSLPPDTLPSSAANDGGETRNVKPTIQIRDDTFVIEVPLAHIVSIAEGAKYSPVEITDQVKFADYLRRYLEHPRDHEDDVLEALNNAIRHVCDDAVYVGAGIRSRLNDITHLIDRMWRNHEKLVATIHGFPKGMTVHMCLVEAIRLARAGDLAAAADWLETGQDLNEPVADVLKENVEEAMRYAIAKYGSGSEPSAASDE